MNWYGRELMATYREREIEKNVEYRRLTTPSRERRPFHFWLITVLRAWIIGVSA